jgi:hypothetical protein
MFLEDLIFHEIGQILLLCAAIHLSVDARDAAARNAMRFALAGQKGAKQLTTQMIDVAVSSPDPSGVLGGPIPAVMQVTNRSSVPIGIMVPYPDSEDLTFTSKSPDLAEPRDLGENQDELTPVTTIGAEQTRTWTYYLNRYFRFKKSGTGVIFFRFQTLLTSAGNAPSKAYERVVFQGDFTVHLLDAPKDGLRNELQKYAVALESPDQQEREQAAEALSHLETPISAEYGARMLSISGLEVIGLQTLSRFPSTANETLIVSMLNHDESEVVAETLRKIDELHISVPRQNVRRLLTSDNPSIQWEALDWLAAHPDATDLPFVLPLERDENEGLRTRAKEYAQSLRHSAQ